MPVYTKKSCPQGAGTPTLYWGRGALFKVAVLAKAESEWERGEIIVILRKAISSNRNQAVTGFKVTLE